MSVLVPASRAYYKANLSVWHLALALIAPVLALYLRDWDIVVQAAKQSEWYVVGSYWATTAASSLFFFLVFRIHDEIAYYVSVQDVLDILKAVVCIELAACTFLFFLTRLDGIPRSTPIIHGMLLVGGLVAIRALLGRRQRRGNQAADGAIDAGCTIVIGANRLAGCFIRLLNANASAKTRVTAVLDERASFLGRTLSGARIVGSPRNLDAVIAEFAIHGVRVEQIVIAGEHGLLTEASLNEVQRVCRNRQLSLTFVPDMIGLAPKSSSSEPLLLSAETEATAELPFYFAVKRWIDLICSLVLIVFLAPLLTVATLLVLLDLGRPIHFWQRRMGRHGRPFNIYKFRTLRAPFDSQGNHVLESERMSPIGRLLRKTRIDELPQLLNVVRGDMSLIGPRPLLPEDQPQNAPLRLFVRPGITGWAQVCGGKLVSTEEKGRLDEWYIRHASFWLDLRIILMTMKTLSDDDSAKAEALADEQQVQRKGTATTWPHTEAPAPFPITRKAQ
jgi:lipopolysaccharide/colanic/teichoic acid biosynthesis glycosyltransferase